MSRRAEADPRLRGLDSHIKPLVPIFDKLQQRCVGQEQEVHLPNDYAPVSAMIFPIGPLHSDHLQDRAQLDALHMEAFCTNLHAPAHTPEGSQIYAGLTFVNANTPSTAGSLLVYRPHTSTKRQPGLKVFVSHHQICAVDLDAMKQPGTATAHLFGDEGAGTHLDWLAARLGVEERMRNTNDTLPVVAHLKLHGIKHVPLEVFSEIISATTNILSRSSQ